jgi:catechol 2,3-dioxygenase-like lactoylglutathione lyase family enzyme
MLDAFQLIEVAAETLTADRIEALWGLTGHSGETAVFETPGTPFGVRVVQLTPSANTTIRDPASGYDSNALKVIDFFTSDFDRAVRRLERHGFKLKEDIAEYEIESGSVLEGHLWGPDNVVCALVSGPGTFLSSFVTVKDAVVSEVHSVSCPVDDPDAVIAFYRNVLGLEEVYRYEVTDESFQHLVGAKTRLHIRAVNMGLRREEPYFGIIHYGLPTDSYRSLKDNAKLPNRGMVGAILWVEDIAAVHRVCAEQRVPIRAPLTELEVAPYGRVKSMSIESPHGVLHQLLQLPGRYRDMDLFAPIRAR